MLAKKHAITLELLNRVNISLLDCRTAREMARLLINEKFSCFSESKINAIRLALYTMLIVSYSRPFHRSSSESINENVKQKVGERYKKIKEKILCQFTNEERKLHEHLMDQRDKEYAHSDASSYSMSQFQSEIGLIPISRNPFVVPDDLYISNIICLIEKAESVLSSKKSELELVLSRDQSQGIRNIY